MRTFTAIGEILPGPERYDLRPVESCRFQVQEMKKEKMAFG